jgi:hypothetical protein
MDGRGGIGRRYLAGDEPVEQRPHRGERLLHAPRVSPEGLSPTRPRRAEKNST